MVQTNRTNGSGSWQDRVHEIVLEDSLMATIRQWVTQQSLDADDAIEMLVADGASIRIRYVERYSCYTFSIGLPKDSAFLKGHTYWFYWGDVVNGLSIAVWMYQQYLPDLKEQNGKLRRVTSW